LSLCAYFIEKKSTVISLEKTRLKSLLQPGLLSSLAPQVYAIGQSLCGLRRFDQHQLYQQQQLRWPTATMGQDYSDQQQQMSSKKLFCWFWQHLQCFIW